MYIKRQIDKELSDWKNSNGKKPILLRGARQVGKTNTVRNLSRQFKNYLEINFEEDKKVHSVFEGNLSPFEICENLSAIFNVSIIPGKTLLFLDEIQKCIPAIESLRFFYEKMPELHVIAAGSLLEFALEEISSFGVGRIRSMFMYSFSFNEFLSALNEDSLIQLKQQASPTKALNDAVHDKLLNYSKKFIMLGGMPEVVATYAKTKDFNLCRQIIDDIIISYNDDFAKYKKQVPATRINEVFNSVILQAGNKFIFSKATKNANQKQIKEALNLLIKAGIVIPVTHTSANGIPLGAEVNPKKQKMLLFDTGIFLRILDFDIGEILFTNDFNIINKGNVAEQFVGLEMMKEKSCYQKQNLYYWHREATNSNAEVDYLFAKNQEIYPVEVKAGTKGSMQSLYLFLQTKNRKIGIRISNENFSTFENIFVYPIYAVENIVNL
ncbi:MAG: AAA family ATPase [Bacteroidales bacterium]|nr:AAA family ATPase [Bacteroidales bacterium]